jgi:hypothetical protein
MGVVLTVARQSPKLKDRVQILAPMPIWDCSLVVEQDAHNVQVVGSIPTSPTRMPVQVC